jgi:transposase
MLAELVDAVIGVDTHRDTHQVEIALPTGTPIATLTISNDSAGFATLLAWIFDHAPGPRLVVSIEGTRSYGVGLARAIAAAGLMVLECAQPHRAARRGKGKSDPSMRIWPCSPRCAATSSGCRPRVPTRGPGSAADPARRPPRPHHRADQPVTGTTPGRRRRRPADRPRCAVGHRPGRPGPAPQPPRRRPHPGGAPRRTAPPRARSPRRRRALTANRAQLQVIVNDLAPGLTDRRGIGTPLA